MARAKKIEIITEAKPRTIKKFELIEKYVEAWAYKILNYQGNPGYAPARGVIFIDCMSNSGVYRDENGNRVEGTALRVARCLDKIFANYPTKKAILIFNDLESVRVDYLETEIEKLQLQHVEVELQIPYRVCAEISQKSILQGKASSNRKDFAAVMRMERCKDHRSRSMSGSYSSFRGDSTEVLHFEFYGIPQRKKCCNAVRAIRRTEV